MINYARTTIRDIATEVEFRIKSFVNEFNFDEDTLLFYIVYTCRKLVLNLLYYQNWGFINTVEVTHKSLLPLNFIKDVRLIITNLPNKVEARRVNIREWYKLSNWRYRHNWNKATTQSPIYTITGTLYEGLGLPNTYRRLTIYIAPNNDFQIGSPPEDYEYYEGNPLIGILEYYSVPDFNLTLSSNFPLPEIFREIVVLEVVSRFLSKYMDNYLSLSLHKELFQAKLNLWNQYIKSKQSTRRAMDVFVEPVPPLTEVPPMTGELPSKL